MKEKATYGNRYTGKMRWGRAVVCAVAGCLAFGLSADVDAEARIPIVGWAGFSQGKASAERYAEAKDAGFTHLTQWCETPSDAGRLLAEAEKAGVKLIIGFGGRNIKRMTDEAEAFTAVAKGSPALEYYFIADEPHIGRAGAGTEPSPMPARTRTSSGLNPGMSPFSPRRDDLSRFSCVGPALLGVIFRRYLKITAFNGMIRVVLTTARKKAHG